MSTLNDRLAGGGARFLRWRSPANRADRTQPCDLCGAALAARHGHLLRTADRKLLCVCEACAILLAGGPDSSYRAIGRRVEWWPRFHLTDRQWQSLKIPVELAFFVPDSHTRQVVAFYPSPAGAAQALPPEPAWREVLDCNPILRELEPDVEALLINRIHGAREAFRAPIDQCFQLAGIIRTRWRGLSGGSEVWPEVAAFFTQLKERAAPGGERA